jgi:hypothetical protein
MRHFVSQNARLVTSILNACELCASEHPPDDILFGDPVDLLAEEEVEDEASVDRFLECDG